MSGDRIGISHVDDVTLPLVDILTGRGFVTGKSGSGKSNSVNVIVEEILDRNQPTLIVDTDGEYWGLKERYELLHLGNDDRCDVQVTANDAGTIVDLALETQVPIILDISGFLHSEDAEEVVHRVVRELFNREKSIKQPFLLVVEEVHEYIPESGGLSDVGETLIQVAKRGRKHGLGFLGVSQRPASVDKDFITQCDWIVWHRLTWKNDTEVVRSILGKDASRTVEELDLGECLLMTDWDEQLRQVQVRQKRTFDAGATPGLDEDFQPPELIPVSRSLLTEFDRQRVNQPDTARSADDGAGSTAGDDTASRSEPSAGQNEAAEAADEPVSAETNPMTAGPDDPSLAKEDGADDRGSDRSGESAAGENPDDAADDQPTVEPLEVPESGPDEAGPGTSAETRDEGDDAEADPGPAPNAEAAVVEPHPPADDPAMTGGAVADPQAPAGGEIETRAPRAPAAAEADPVPKRRGGGRGRARNRQARSTPAHTVERYGPIEPPMARPTPPPSDDDPLLVEFGQLLIYLAALAAYAVTTGLHRWYVLLRRAIADRSHQLGLHRGDGIVVFWLVLVVAGIVLLSLLVASLL